MTIGKDKPIGSFDALESYDNSLSGDAAATQIVPGKQGFWSNYAALARLDRQRQQEEARIAAEAEERLHPFNPGFTLDSYAKDDIYKENRALDDADRAATQQAVQAEDAEDTPGAAARPWTTRPAAHAKIREIGPVAVGEKQAEYFAALKGVQATTGVPVGLVGAMWGNESRFSSLGNSPTGCVGPGQFCRGTFAAVIKQYGDRIPGMETYAAGLRDGSIKADDAGLQAMRNDQKVSAYASGFYLGEIARSLKVDPSDKANWGKIYAGYVVGPENARRMMQAAATGDDRTAAGMFPKEAGYNPMFFAGGAATSSQALATFQNTLETTHRAFTNQIVAKLDTGSTMDNLALNGKSPSDTIVIPAQSRPRQLSPAIASVS